MASSVALQSIVEGEDDLGYGAFYRRLEEKTACLNHNKNIELQIRFFKKGAEIVTSVYKAHRPESRDDTGFAPIGWDEPYRVIISEDPIGLAGGDVNFYVYVGNNPVNWVDPLGLETYRCTKPLNALGGSGTKSGPDIWGNPAYHQYSCVWLSDGSYQCGGQDHKGSAWHGPGKPSNDDFNPDRCKQSQPDNDCFERCLIDEWSKPRPIYGIPFGTDCQEYDDDVNKRCLKKCSGKK